MFYHSIKQGRKPFLFIQFLVVVVVVVVVVFELRLIRKNLERWFL